MPRWLCVGSVVRVNMSSVELARAISSPSGEGEGEGEGSLSVLQVRIAKRIRTLANRRLQPIFPDFPQTSPSLHTSPFSLHKLPVFSAH